MSVSETIRWPSATNWSASSTWFSMMPLWMSARRPEQSESGCAFSSEGRPWVAQRVWPMPADAPFGAPSARLTRSSRERVPLAARALQIPSSPGAPTSATPAES